MAEHLFIGRAADRKRVIDALANHEVVTLVGTFGVGKTRLSQSVSESFVHPLFIDCSHSFDRDSVVHAATDAIGSQIDSATFDRIGHAIEAGGYDLVVFDNAEQVLDSAREFADLRGPGYKTLFTSRESLGVKDEHVVPLSPLDTDGAMELFVSLAQRVEPEFTIPDDHLDEFRSFLDRLDRLPLVIQLAAGRIATVPPRVILSELISRFDAMKTAGLSDRQASVTGAISWSWTLLDEEEQEALVAASVFRGAFSMTDFLEVADGNLRLPDLVSKSLLFSMSDALDPLNRRFQPFESVKRFAQTTNHDKTTEFERRFVSYFEQQAEQYMSGGRERFDFANSMLAFELSQQNGALARALNRFLRFRGSLEFRRSLLASVKALDPHHTLATCESVDIHVSLGEIDAAETAVANLEPSTEFEAARVAFANLRLAQIRGDGERFLSLSESILGYPNKSAREVLRLKALTLAAIAPTSDGGREMFQRGITLAKQYGDPSTIAKVRNAAASHALTSGEFERAERLYQEGLDGIEDQDDARLRAAIGANLGLVAHYRGNLDAATEAYNSARLTFNRIGLLRESAIMEGNMGAVAVDAGRLDQAEESLADAAFVLEQCDPEALVQVLGVQATLWHARGDLQRAIEHYDSEKIRKLEFVTVYNAVASLQLEQPARAADLISAKEFHSPIWRFAASHVGRFCGVDVTAEAAVPRFISDAITASDPRWLFARLLKKVAPTSSEKMVVDHDGHWFDRGDGAVDIARRGPARKLFLHLVEHHQSGEAFDLDALFEVGWPDQKIDVESAHKRVYAAIGTLRRLGLEGVIVTTDDGYMISPKLRVERG